MRLTREEKITIGVAAVVYPAISVWPWYNVAKAVGAAGVAERVRECVCGRFFGTCQSELGQIIGPGLAVVNATLFCGEASSSLNLARAAASSNTLYYTLFGAGMVLFGAGMIAKTLHTAYKRSRQEMMLQELD